MPRHIWQSSRDLAEDAARATRGTICAIDEEAGTITIRPVDPIAEAVAAEREACARAVEALPEWSSGYGSGGNPWPEAAEAIRARATPPPIADVAPTPERA